MAKTNKMDFLYLKEFYTNSLTEERDDYLDFHPFVVPVWYELQRQRWIKVLVSYFCIVSTLMRKLWSDVHKRMSRRVYSLPRNIWF